VNRPEELKAILLKALDEPHCLIVKVDGGGPAKRQTAIVALQAAKRELLPDEPRMLNIQIRALSGSQDEIAIVHLSDPLENET